MGPIGSAQHENAEEPGTSNQGEEHDRCFWRYNERIQYHV